MRVFVVFISSVKRIHLQRQKCSSPDQHKTRSSLAINTFVCSAMSYFEVSRGGYLVASNKQVCLQHVILCSEISSRGYLITSNYAFVCSVISYLEVKTGIKTPQTAVNSGKKFMRNVISSRDWAGKSAETRQGWENLKNPPHYRTMPVPSLASNAMHLHP